MIQTKTIEDIVNKLDQLVPGDIKTMGEEFKKNAQLILTSTLQKADLVTREEFEVQKAVLSKTRAKLEALEKQLEQLENIKNQ